MSESQSPRARRLPGTVRVLVVDDSALMRRLIVDLLERDAAIQVVGTAKDGIEALEKVASLKPDVVLLDIAMPRLDGLEFLRRLSRKQPVPVVVLTGIQDERVVQQAYQLGAFDVVLKPSGPISVDIASVADELRRKVKLAGVSGVKPPETSRPALSAPRSSSRFELQPRRSNWAVVIGASTGGPRAVERVLCGLPVDIPATVLIVQHMPLHFTRSFAERLNRQCALPVKEGEEGDVLRVGMAYVAPGGYHMRVRRSGRGMGEIYLDEGPPVNNVRPSVDVTMYDVADVFLHRTIGVLLTGMGTDGARGLKYIRERGGHTIAQDSKTSVVYGMPRAAADLSAAEYILPLDAIPEMIVRLLSEEE